MMKQRLAALVLGWVAGLLALLGAYVVGADGWPITVAIFCTGFAVSLAAIFWPFL